MPTWTRSLARTLAVAIAATLFASSNARAYSDVVIENTTEYAVSGTVHYASQPATQTPTAMPIDPQESAFDRDLSQRIAALLFDNCSQRGTVQSSNPNSGRRHPVALRADLSG